jgi:hypothetical protein
MSNGINIGKNLAQDTGRLFGHSGKLFSHSGKTVKILLYRNLPLLLIKR